MKHRKSLAGFALASTLLIAACGGSDSGTSTDDTTAEDPPAATSAAEPDATTAPDAPDDTAAPEEPAATTAPAEEPPAGAGGTLTVTTATAVQQLNPAIRTFAEEETLFPLLWNGLTQTDEAGDVIGDLAESWEASDDLQTWTFNLRSDVLYNNGEPFTAESVVGAFEYYLADDTATQEANKIAAIDSVEAADDATVVFSLSAPIATFPAGIVWVKMIDVSSLDSIDQSPVGTGPFMVADFTPGNNLLLERNPNYFGDPASLDGIEFVVTGESTASVTALRSGDVDVVPGVPQGDVAQFEAEGSITVVRPASPTRWPSWEMDLTSPPFDDVRARQALAYATDRDAILDIAYFGQGTVSNTNSALADNNSWFGGELTDYSYDLEKAKELFTAAGVNEGDTLTWWGIAGEEPAWQTSGEILQASLAEIGINLEISNNDVGTWVSAFYPAGLSFPGLVVPNFQSTPAEPAYSLNFYLDGRCECNWKNDDFEAAFAAAVAEGDDDARAAQWVTVQEIINEEVPLIVPLQEAVVSATGSNVTGVWLEGGGQMHLEDAAFTD